MPIEPEANNSTETNKADVGWLATCGLIISSLSVRGRRGFEENQNRLAMGPADNKGQKRKREKMSPISSLFRKPSRSNMENKSNKLQIQQEPETPGVLAMLSKIPPEELFKAALSNTQVHSAYDAEREQLLSSEEETAWDRDARRSATDTERKAGYIISVLREFERNEIFGNIASEAIPGSKTLDMGGQFLTNKKRINTESKVFKIAMKMPKGAILHLHFNAELAPERLLEEARTMENIFIRSLQPLLTQDNLDQTELIFQVLPKDTPCNNIFSPDYQGGQVNPKAPESKDVMWMKWKDFRQNFPFKAKYSKPTTDPLENNGTLPNSSEQGAVNLDPAETWVLEKMVLSEEEAYGPSQTVNGVWARFNQATRCFKGLINYEQVYKWYIDKAIDTMIEEKVMYAELRPMLLDKAIPTDDGNAVLDLSAQMQLIQDCVELKKKKLQEEGRLRQFPFGLKIIYCTPRSIPNALMQKEILDCIRLKEKFPDLICGFDLVGAEDRPNNIGFYSKELKALEKVCKDKDLEIPFLFHAGETLLDAGGSKGVDPRKSNLYDAVILKAKRIGHGFSLLKHPHLIEEFKKTPTKPGICIELCPISNELLHLCRNVKEHPFSEILAAGIPCTVNSDNPSLFSNSMSHEFYQIMVGAPTISIHSWKQLALWSLEYSCLSEDEKKQAHAIFMEDWEAFCKSIVEEYGDLIVADENLRNDNLKKAYHPYTNSG